jgi:hypothetical protein
VLAGLTAAVLFGCSAPIVSALTASGSALSIAGLPFAGATLSLLALIETPEAMEGYVLRAQGQDDAKRRAQRSITTVQEASRLAAGHTRPKSWSTSNGNCSSGTVSSPRNIWALGR